MAHCVIQVVHSLFLSRLARQQRPCKMQLLTVFVLSPLILASSFAVNVRLRNLMETQDFKTCFGLNSTLYDLYGLDYTLPGCTEIFMSTVKFSNLTKKDVHLMDSLGREVLSELQDSSRNKRYIKPLRIRRECRTLSEKARNRIFNAIVEMKLGRKKMYDAFARIHLNPESLDNAHGGSNFPGWHRLYVLFFENALRRIAPGVVLCYWDPTLDYMMKGTLQIHSVTFSDRLFGNGYGTVINGPFKNWQLFEPYSFRLKRNIGQEGSLTRPEVIDIITRNPKIIRSTWISAGSGAIGFKDPDTGRRHSLEQCHDNTHVYIGEVFSSLPVTAQDPIFWFFHAYVDYVWELFRTKQRQHGIDPSKDYPEHGGEDHRALHRMVPFFAFRNIDGYDNMLTEKIYRYDPSPVCGNRCGGASKEFLYCPRGGHRRSRCVSRARNVDFVPNKTLKEIHNPLLEKFVSGNKVSKGILCGISLEVARKDGYVKLPLPLFRASFDDRRVFVGKVSQKNVYGNGGGKK